MRSEACQTSRGGTRPLSPSSPAQPAGQAQYPKRKVDWADNIHDEDDDEAKEDGDHEEPVLWRSVSASSKRRSLSPDSSAHSVASSDTKLPNERTTTRWQSQVG